jgi:hypothetical protein
MTTHLTPFQERLRWIDTLTDPPIRLGHYIRLIWELSLWDKNPDRVVYEDGSANNFGEPDKTRTWRLLAEIGLRIHKTGGMNAMWTAYYALQADDGICLELAWDGIGDWRA